MKAEELTIVGAVGRLWDKSHARLRVALDEAPNGPHEWRIGGGTILAARWGHRTSFDIDITVGRNTDLKEVRDGATQHVQALAEELQGSYRRRGTKPHSAAASTIREKPGAEQVRTRYLEVAAGTQPPGTQRESERRDHHGTGHRADTARKAGTRREEPCA
jgi:hypothetical protein